MKLLKYAFFALLGILFIGFIGIIVLVGTFSKDLPSLDAVKNYTPLLVTTVYSDDGKIVAEFSEQRRKTLKDTEIPKNVINAFVAAEDNEFFTHRGINPVTIVRAAVKNFMAGHTVQGGSTITQQVAKSILLTPEKSFSRKIKEMLLAFRIEKELTKPEIIALYLNHIFLGEGAYGVEAASLTYFGKSAIEISVPEAAILAGLPKAPSRDNPVKNPKAAKQRQLYVLDRMLASGFISKSQWAEYKTASIQIKNKVDFYDSPAPYYTEYIRRYLLQKYGEEQLKGAGLKVYTTMNLAAQKAAQDAIKVGLIALDKRVGLRQPSISLKNPKEIQDFLTKEHKQVLEKFYNYKILNGSGELVTALDFKEPTPIELGKNYSAVLIEKVGSKKMKQLFVKVGNRSGVLQPEDYAWPTRAHMEEIYSEAMIHNPFAQLKVGDVITVQPKKIGKDGRDEYFLEQEPLVQGALLSYRVPDGAMQAMVGGYDFAVTKSEFNRATQAVRQPGSTFKPFVYATALENGYTPSTVIVDSPIIYKDTDEKTNLEKRWRPDNFGEKFYGDTLLRNALAYSRNIPTIKLLQHLKVQTVIEFARKMGIKSPLNPDLSLALGSNGLTLEELVRGWGIFANQGNRFTPYFIKKIEDRNGTVLEEYKPPEPERVILDSTAFLMTSILKSVVEFGTATSVKVLGRPVAGKTGTTNDFKDALFMGFIPQMITGVWVGFDEDRPLGRNETGAQAAAPIWLQYMQVATAGIPIKDFEVPPSVMSMTIDGETGDVPTPQTKKRVQEFYAVGTAPGQPIIPLPNAAQPGTSQALALAANTEGKVNKTQVITGNSEAARNAAKDSANPKPPESDINADEVMRDDL